MGKIEPKFSQSGQPDRFFTVFFYPFPYIVIETTIISETKSILREMSTTPSSDK